MHFNKESNRLNQPLIAIIHQKLPRISLAKEEHSTQLDETVKKGVVQATP